MVMLHKYEEFIDRVEELGFMAFSDILPGFPSLSAETPKNIWFTGDMDTDPWCWKDRAAGEKKLAFGCILGGHKGFISKRLYYMFYKAYHPDQHMEERMETGQVSQMVWRLWQLFESRGFLDTGDIRKVCGVTKKKGGSKVDTAVKELQQSFYITVAGNKQKLDKYGRPYGWPSNVYERVTDWVPAEWMDASRDVNGEEARERILDIGISISRHADRTELARKIGLRQHLAG